ncbi:14156_t:CDS:2, partial [Gigaspora rosea]
LSRLDEGPLLIDDELFLDEPVIDSKPVSDKEPLLLPEGSNNYTQNKASKSSQQNVIVSKRKTDNLQNNNTNKKPKPGKSWVWHYMKKDKHAKMINCRTWIGGNDNLNQCTHSFEITTSTTNLAGHLRTVHRLNKTGPLLSLSGEKEVAQLQPIRFDLSQSTLVEVVNSIKKLQQDFAKDKERGIRNNAKILEKLLLNDDDLLEIQELVELLGPFAHVTTIVGVRVEIELSFSECWEEPGPEGYIAAMLDPRFKDI